MAFKVGSTTVIDNSRNITSGQANGAAAAPFGIFNNSGYDVSQLIRFTTYTDDLGNCRGYLPTGNCLGSSSYQVPNGNWWTWGVSGISTAITGNPGGFDFASGKTSAYYTVSTNLVYDAYYELYNRVRGSDQHRGYSHCNCNSGYNSVGNCYTNCACNCDCACDCACACACNC